MNVTDRSKSVQCSPLMFFAGAARIRIHHCAIFSLILMVAQIGGAASAFAQTWQFVPGGAKDIGVGADGTVWKIGTVPQGGYGYNIARWDGSLNQWVGIGGGAMRIDVDPNGDPWVVNSNGNIYTFSSGVWHLIPGKAKDIGIGANGDVWKIGTNNSVSKRVGNIWVPVSGSAVRIDVDPQGDPWVVNVNGNIYKYTQSLAIWRSIPGKATDIGVGANGAVWKTGAPPPPGNIYGWEISEWNGFVWDPPVGGAAEEISVGPDGKPWVVNLLDSVYRRF